MNAIFNFFMFITNSIIYVSFLIVPSFLFLKKRKALLPYLTGFSITFVIIYLIKFLFNVPRPEQASIILTTPSFPSAHAGISFYLVSFFFMWFYESGDAKSEKIIKFLKYETPLFFYAVLICFSRIYLDVHYWTDVIVGALIGIITGYFIYKKKRAVSERFKKFGNIYKL